MIEESKNADAAKLKGIVLKRVEFITKDCDTFLNLKRDPRNLLVEWNSGGGNYVMATGTAVVWRSGCF